MPKLIHLNKWRDYNLAKKTLNDICASLEITKIQFHYMSIDEIEKLIGKRKYNEIVLKNNHIDKIIRNTLCKLGWHIRYVLTFKFIAVSNYKCIYCGKKIIIRNEIEHCW